MMAWLVLGVDEWLGVKRDDLRGLFECSMEGCICGSGNRGVSSIGFAAQFNGKGEGLSLMVVLLMIMDEGGRFGGLG
ncbi:hypothetical protein V6N13_105918 [Hibiscus sabdariffa]